MLHTARDACRTTDGGKSIEEASKINCEQACKLSGGLPFDRVAENPPHPGTEAGRTPPRAVPGRGRRTAE